ncbi:MAG: DUF362 domain-containing protein, partial [Syntrophomonadaceae bacterium]|nr:DUF362 domain-containing protein [Syntrophomonadaceae bacterium]
MAAKVFFTNMRAPGNISLLDKMQRLLKKVGLNDIVAPGDLVAIKVHFGEPGNLAYIRPQYIRRLVDRIKKIGAKPFITDANT